MDLGIRAVFIFCFIYLLTRVIGRRELSSLEPFDLILLILIVVGTFALLQVFVSYLSFRFPRLRPALDGEPIVVVQDGKPIERNLKRERLAVEEVLEEARQQQVAKLEDIEWAVLE